MISIPDRREFQAHATTGMYMPHHAEEVASPIN
jgi:hypothetical protein